MDPLQFVDVGSQLRGLGNRKTKLDTVHPWPACSHAQPEHITQTWTEFVAGERPKALRNPTLGADYVLDCIKPSAPGNDVSSVLDVRSPREIIGTSSRIDARYESRCK